MSTRSGKRIHISFHENTMKSEADFTRSERKTRSKHAKENFDELNECPKVKKRNYVAFPDDDDGTGIDTVDCKLEEKTIRILRKNALKERNTTSSTESVEPAADSRKSVRSTRRTRKFDENPQDTPIVAPQDEEVNKVEVPKSKKGKKKKKIEKEQVVEIKMTEPKKKSKKKKDRRSSSIIVEDMEIEAPSGLNKSNISADSFHSAAGSPRNCHEPVLHKDLDIENSTFENYDLNIRKTRSSMKLDNILTNDNVTESVPRKRRSSVKVILDNHLEDATIKKDKNNQETSLIKESKKRKSRVNDVTASEDTTDDKNSTPDIKMNTKRNSLKNATFDKTVVKPTVVNTTFEKNDTIVISSQKLKTKHTIDENVNEASGNIEDASFEKDSATESVPKGKKIKSAVNALIKDTDKQSPLKSTGKDNKRKTIVNETIKVNQENNSNENSPPFKVSQIKLFIGETKRKPVEDTTLEKDAETESESLEKKKSLDNMTFDLTSSPFKSANALSSPLIMTTDNGFKCKSIINTTFEKDSDTDHEDKKRKTTCLLTPTFDKNITETNDSNKNKKTHEIQNKRKSLLRLSTQKVTNTEINSTFDIDQEKLDATFDKNSKSSLISSDSSMVTLDKSNASRISITSDESKNEENILNTTPVLIESSMEDCQMNITKTPPKIESVTPVTPLKREGTFTKDEPEVMCSPKSSLSRTPTKRMSLPSPGFTPFHANKSSSKEKSVLNLTRSIEKRRSSLAEPPRTTKVMFCSPVNNPAMLTQNRRKVIKSNLKGSNKSFVFDDNVSLESRKRSYTQSDAEEARVKRKRLADELQQSVDRLSRPRTSSASAKLAEPTTPSKKHTTPSKKSDAKLSRTKLPNFAALHQKQFAKMESLDECQERKAKRAKQLLTPTGAVNMLERISPKEKAAEPEKPKEAPEKSKEAPRKPETPIKSLPTFKSLNPGYTRFGFKLNLDVNPFSIPSTAQPKPKDNKPKGLARVPTLPSLAGATSVRREVAKQTVMREKSFTDRSAKRTENRTVIKGVRTNRRFELQMRMRNI